MSNLHVRLKVLMAFAMKNAIFWDVVLCSSCEKKGFGRRVERSCERQTAIAIG
jgi:hypothetical protein